MRNGGVGSTNWLRDGTHGGNGKMASSSEYLGSDGGRAEEKGLCSRGGEGVVELGHEPAAQWGAHRRLGEEAVETGGGDGQWSYSSLRGLEEKTVACAPAQQGLECARGPSWHARKRQRCHRLASATWCAWLGCCGRFDWRG